MGCTIFIGKQSNGPPAAGTLLPGYGAEQQGRAGGKRGAGGGRTLNLPHCQFSALPISSVRQPDVPLLVYVPLCQPLPLPQRETTE